MGRPPLRVSFSDDAPGARTDGESHKRGFQLPPPENRWPLISGHETTGSTRDGAATLTAGTAGCSGLPGTASLGRPEERLNDDGRGKHLVFRAGDDRIVVISLDQRTRRESPAARFRFRLYVAHGYGDEANGRFEPIERSEDAP